MKKNVGNLDRALRLVISAAFVLLYFSGVLSGTIGLIALVVAAVLAVTTIMGYCPLYSVIGVNSCKVKEAK